MTLMSDLAKNAHFMRPGGAGRRKDGARVPKHRLNSPDQTAAVDA